MALELRAGPPAPIRIYEHPLIDWGAVIGGTVVAIAVGFTLTLLGVAIGATAINPWQPASEQAPGWTIGGGLWVVFSNLVAIQVGAFVAARAARWSDHHSGMLQGLMVWALAFVVAIAVVGAGIAGMLGAAADTTTLHKIVQGAADAAQTATGEPSGAASQLSTAETDAVQDAAALTAWWAFAFMVLGGVGAVAGGRLGAEHPDWHARHKRERPVTMADPVVIDPVAKS
jgi:hypothetical protein